MVFEIQTVTHEADIIHFTWTDSGGSYHVYRDGVSLYEGTVPEFGDGDFTHAKVYHYAIERVVNDEVVEVIALQTTAFAEERNVENPLQSLVMTTIVAKSQIALSWEKVKDVNEYDVYRNGTLMKTVKENRFIDRDFSLDLPYIYTISSRRPLAKSEEVLSKSKSTVAKVFGNLNPASTEEAAEVEKFTVHKWIPNPRKLLVPVCACGERDDVDQWHFRYTTFLKDYMVKNPNILSRNHYFKGDARSFDADSDRYRTRVDAVLDYAKDGSPLTFKKDVGQTVAYNYLKKVRGTDVASSEGIVLKRADHSEGESGFYLTHAVGNPLVTAPEINYEVNAVFRRDGAIDMTGFHDQAPHHEIYIRRGDGDAWMPVHLAESEGLAWMSMITAWHYWRFSNFE